MTCERSFHGFNIMSNLSGKKIGKNSVYLGIKEFKFGFVYFAPTTRCALYTGRYKKWI